MPGLFELSSAARAKLNSPKTLFKWQEQEEEEEEEEDEWSVKAAAAAAAEAPSCLNLRQLTTPERQRHQVRVRQEMKPS
ncbi:uncharacterized protein J3R85_006080 [Psidium guajava]|nr:uncharacterized protein J3R85_006080 [Psidium guajava]